MVSLRKFTCLYLRTVASVSITFPLILRNSPIFEFTGKIYLDLIHIQLFEIPVTFPKMNVCPQKYRTSTWEDISLQSFSPFNSQPSIIPLYKGLSIQRKALFILYSLYQIQRGFASEKYLEMKMAGKPCQTGWWVNFAALRLLVIRGE
jgi:hypothetical protein